MLVSFLLFSRSNIRMHAKSYTLLKAVEKSRYSLILKNIDRMESTVLNKTCEGTFLNKTFSATLTSTYTTFTPHRAYFMHKEVHFNSKVV